MDHQSRSEKPIGVFDSGVGGLSVLRAIRSELPNEDILYFGDQAHVPYGSRTLSEVRQLSEGVVHFLLEEAAKLIVVACNTASAAALHYLREIFPDVPFVGMEPAVKPAAEHTHTGRVGILATPATFQGELYASVVERFAQGVIILQDTCPGLVGQIEAGRLKTKKTRQILEQALKPMLAEGIDTVVLGCTHYPFVIPLIKQIVGPDVQVIDPAPAIARQTIHLLNRDQIAKHGPQLGRLTFFTSADPAALHMLLPKLLEETVPVLGLQWISDRLVRA
ncbi:MAG: glutamate racemase [Chloroflexota bacterium]